MAAYELLLASGRVAAWPGRDGVDAAVRYVDAHPECGAVIAWREPRAAQIRVGYS